MDSLSTNKIHFTQTPTIWILFLYSCNKPRATLGTVIPSQKPSDYKNLICVSHDSWLMSIQRYKQANTPFNSKACAKCDRTNWVSDLLHPLSIFVVLKKHVYKREHRGDWFWRTEISNSCLLLYNSTLPFSTVKQCTANALKIVTIDFLLPLRNPNRQFHSPHRPTLETTCDNNVK